LLKEAIVPKSHRTPVFIEELDDLFRFPMRTLAEFRFLDALLAANMRNALPLTTDRYELKRLVTTEKLVRKILHT
jgi:hypothetical protein